MANRTVGQIAEEAIARLKAKRGRLFWIIGGIILATFALKVAFSMGRDTGYQKGRDTGYQNGYQRGHNDGQIQRENNDAFWGGVVGQILSNLLF